MDDVAKQLGKQLGIEENVVDSVMDGLEAEFVLIPRSPIVTTRRVSKGEKEAEVTITFDLSDATPDEVLNLVEGKAVVEAQNRFLRPSLEAGGLMPRSNHTYHLSALVGSRRADPQSKVEANFEKLTPEQQLEWLERQMARIGAGPAKEPAVTADAESAPKEAGTKAAKSRKGGN